VASAVLTFVSKDTVSSSEAEGATVVVLSDTNYDKATYDFESGGKVLVRNDDPFTHTFTITALGIDITMTPGSETIVQLPEKPGAYVVFCRPHSGDPKDLQDPDNINPDDMAARVEIN
jgi:plastocyanin